MAGFSEKVWELTKRIPKGKVTTYGEIARALGRPGPARAVGQALKRNPHAPAVPCHRVVKSDGGLGGYGGLWLVPGDATTRFIFCIVNL